MGIEYSTHENETRNAYCERIIARCQQQKKEKLQNELKLSLNEDRNRLIKELEKSLTA